MKNQTKVKIQLRSTTNEKFGSFFIACFNQQALCTAVAVSRHFFYTAVFTWMLVEAVNLFMKLVKVISTKTFFMTYLSIGWGKLEPSRTRN